MIRQASLLVVDDDEMNRDMLSQRLELNGYAVTAADSGRSALAMVGEQAFDVVLLDVMMPDLSGLEVLRLIRETTSAAELPIIMVTARDQGADVVEAFRLGASDYVTKPIDLPVVLARIASQVTCKRAQSALRQSEERYALAARGTNNGLWDWDLQTDEVYYSPRWKAVLGYEEDEIGSCPEEWFRRIHPEDVERVREDLAAHRKGWTAHFEREHRLMHKDQTYRWMLGRGLAVRDVAGNGLRMAGSLTDITEGKIADALTGLPNRILLLDRIEHAIKRARRDPSFHFAVLFLDLDRFKLVNDSLGHHIGDLLLNEFARRMEGCLRATDTVSRPALGHTIARLGGDEFTILLDGIKDPADAIMVADRIQKSLASPFLLGGNEVFASTSIGIAIGGAHYQRPDDVLRDADMAMYDAKEQGKSRYEMFDVSMRERAMARLQLENELRRALERSEFRVHYQPIIELETGRLQGFEALVRWDHPQRGLISPGDFIPAAEENGLIIPIGWWVLEEACRQMATWVTQYPDSPDLIISVNLSSKQFSHADLCAQVQRQFRASVLEGRHLKLEITESAIMNDPGTASAMLARIRDMGVLIGIDDFGTGYSSLSYLRKFPIDTLKIDRSFIDRMQNDVKDLQMVQTIVKLAHNLGMDVVAEGVETNQQREQLRTAGCEFGQGFYFSKPVDGPAAEALLAAHQPGQVHWIPGRGKFPRYPNSPEVSHLASAPIRLDPHQVVDPSTCAKARQ